MGGGQFHLDPATYLQAVRAEVPAYDELQSALAAASADLVVRRVLDLGTGTGETARRVLARHPEASLVGIDSSPEMVALAAAELASVEVRVGRLEAELPAGPFELVTSALAVHHLTSEDRRSLFARIAAALAPGGRFVLADVVVPEDPADARTPLEPGVDLPDRLGDQMGWLVEAGLEPRVAWSRGDLVVVAADRP